MGVFERGSPSARLSSVCAAKAGPAVEDTRARPRVRWNTDDRREQLVPATYLPAEAVAVEAAGPVNGCGATGPSTNGPMIGPPT